MTTYIPPNTTNKYKDIQSKWKIKSLFYEERVEGYDPLYTLTDDDREVDGTTYPSLRKLYLDCDHIVGNEYEFSNQYLGGWKHWQALCRSPFMRPIIQEWRDELEIKQKAQHIKSIISSTYAEGNVGLAATKYLLEKGYMDKKGRPKKEDIEREAQMLAKAQEAVEDDLERLKLVKGGKI